MTDDIPATEAPDDWIDPVATFTEWADDPDISSTPDQAVMKAQAISQRLVAGRSGASVDDFLANRDRESAAE